jgi:NADH-quinone oxidoreductase subunit D
MSVTENRYAAETSEGPQELWPRSATNALELLREEGAVLRMSETEAAHLEATALPEDETMIINMGPQHPRRAADHAGAPG